MKSANKDISFLLIIPFFLFQSNLDAHELPPGFAAIQIADGLDPVGMAIAPDGRIFFTEKNGRARIVENGQVLLDPFIEIEVDNFNERGLSGIAIDPDFNINHFVYLYYTVPNASHNRLSRFTANGNFAIPNSEQVLLDFDTLAGNNHNAGAMVFAEDGTLFIATGDGTKINAAQNLNSLLGKILRINKDGSIPPDNPFYNETTGKYRAIWSLGHRNPFAMTLEPGSGRIFTTDVGSHRFEEINEIFAGKNYGWPAVEGDFEDELPPANYQAPLYFYNHDLGCAAVGVTTYNPANPTFPPEYWDKVFFSDYCSGKIQTINPLTGDIADFATHINRPLTLLTAPDGTLYYLAREGIGDGSEEDNTASSNGTLWRIFYTGSDAPFISVQPKSTLVSVGENAHFSVAASGASPLFYQWQVNQTAIPFSDSSTFIIENAMLADSGAVVRCIVTNAVGTDTTIEVFLMVTSNKRPVATITHPAEGLLYKAGDALTFSGEAGDAEDGILPPDNFQWKIDFHHNLHTHPAYGPVSGIAGDSFVIPKIGEVSDNVWFRVNFTATDNNGLSNTAQRLVYPLKTNISLETKPSGKPIDANGTLSTTPFILPSVVGVVHDFSAPQSLVTEDSVFIFKEWSNGEISNRITFEAPENDITLTANYEAVQALANGQGLKGNYFDDKLKNFTFQEPAALTRIDPVIDFEWELSSPDEEYLGDDFFLARWEGFVQPLFFDTLHFHVITDDGSRLWIDNQLLVDAWFGQGKNEYTGSVLLEKEKFYPIKLEYFEGIGESTIQLLWSSNQVNRSIIPSSQLFPALPIPSFSGEKMEVSYFPNPVTDLLKFRFGSPAQSTVAFEIFDATGKLVSKQKKGISQGYSDYQISFVDFASGVYFVKLSGGLIDEVFEIIHH